MKALMITGGRVDYKQLSSLYEQNDYNIIIGVDGGCAYAYDLAIPLTTMYGDFDTLDRSAKKDLLAFVKDIIELNPEKNVTDTHGAILEVIKKGASILHVVGGTGTRMDHTWANLMVASGLSDQLDITFYDANNKITFHQGPCCITNISDNYQYISILPIEEVKIVKTLGLKYKVTDLVFSPYESLGVSNEIIGDIMIEVVYGRFMLIRSRD